MKRKNNIPPIIDLSVCDDVHAILPPCPEVGEGVHKAILGAVSQLAFLSYSPEEIPGMVEEWMSPVTTPYPREIPDAILKVFGDGDPRLNGETFARAPKRLGDPHLHGGTVAKAPKWPTADFPNAISIVRARGKLPEWGHLLELWRSSPYDPSQEISTEDWLTLYYQEDDLLCIGEQKFDREVKPLSNWCGNVRYAQFISPNPFRSELWGRKNDNVLTRRYLVTEMDIQPGGVWDLLLQSYQLNSFDVQGGVISHLRELGILKLLSVVHSGRKSLHAYWLADADERVNLSFMQQAVSLGVDKAGWTISQFARILNPGYPEHQELYYLDTP
jgi:hypothetical protein